MEDLVAFIRARLDEDERDSQDVHDRSADAHLDGDCICGYPARVLREVEAKRKIVEEYAEVADNDVDEPYEYAYGWANGLGVAVRNLAVIYADHPDYREEWRP